MRKDYIRKRDEILTCKNQFMVNNKFNFLITVITQTIFSAVSISISFLMMVTSSQTIT